MIRYALRDDLSYCRIDGRLVFLDVGNDRYFHLPRRLERAVTACLDEARPGANVSELVERHILVEREDPPAKTPRSIPRAERSAMERPPAPIGCSGTDLLEVLVTVLQVHWALKRTPLSAVLASVASRGRGAEATELPAVIEPQLANAVSIFRSARLYVPIEMRCLLDSVAMARFLQKRRLPAQVVFGVALDPFSAHCWVQAGDLVLNDTVGNVAAHTPIRVV